MADGDCHFCQVDRDASPETIVYRDDLWTAGLVAPVPGWVMLWTRRHVEGGWALAPDEAAGFGPLYVELAHAVREVCAAERVYLMYTGENAIHFHCLVSAHAADALPEHRGPGVVQKGAELADREEAIRIIGLVRAALDASSRPA